MYDLSKRDARSDSVDYHQHSLPKSMMICRVAWQYIIVPVEGKEAGHVPKQMT